MGVEHTAELEHALFQQHFETSTRAERNGSPIGGQMMAALPRPAAPMRRSPTASRPIISAASRREGPLSLFPIRYVVPNTVVALNGVGLLVSANVSNACATLASDSSVTRNSVFGIEKQGSNAVTSFGGNTVFNNVGNTFALTHGKL